MCKFYYLYPNTKHERGLFMQKTYTSIAKRTLSIVLTIVLCMTSFVIVNPFKAEAILREEYQYHHYYSYPEGTRFLTSLRVGTGSSTISSSDAKKRAQEDSHELIDVDIRKGGGGRYMYLGRKWTYDISEAATYIVISNSSSDNSASPTTGFSVPDFSTGNSFNPSFNIVNGNNSNDLRNSLGGNYVFIWYTQDAKAGLPIVGVEVYAENESDAHSQKGEQWKQVKDVINNFNTINLNQTGKGNSRYLYYDNTSVYTDVTAQMNSLKAAVAQYEGLDSANYTATSWASAVSAYNNAKTLIGEFESNAYYASTKTGTDINNATTALTSALNGLQTTIILDSATNGGAVGSVQSVDVTCGLNSTVSVNVTPYTATKSGWEFIGWNTDKDAKSGTKSGNITTGLASTLYAVYKSSVTANFYYMNADGSDGMQTVSADIYNNENSAAVSCSNYKNSVVKLGKTYTFVGWNRADTATSPAFTDNSVDVVYGTTSYLYAVYTTTHTLSYDANGGSNAPEGVSVTAGANYNATTVDTASVIITSDVPSRTGYSIIGWADTFDAEVAPYQAGAEIALGADKTLYAVWQINTYTLTFINPFDGDKLLGTVGVNYGGTATAPDTAPAILQNNTDTHYVFNGWDSSLENITADATVNAVYTEAEHSYVAIGSQDATCTEDGYEDYLCTECLQTKHVVLKATNHANSRNVAQQDSTCTDIGYTAGVFCDDCGEWLSGHEEIARSGHDENSEWTIVISATCNGNGYKEQKCSRCGELLASDTINALGHNYNETPDSTVAATCSNKGSETYNCTRCDYVDVRELAIDPSNHANTMVVSAQDSTCTNVGYTAGVYCKDCRTYIEGRVETAALGHTLPSVPTSVTAATCISEGTKVYICSVCNGAEEGGKKEEPIAIDPSNHASEETYIKEGTAIAMSCFADGYEGDIYYSCCNIFKENGKTITAPNQHDYKGVITKPATETEQGIIVYTCTRCGDYYTDVIGYVPHNCHGGTATCIAKAKCEVCGNEYGDVDSSNHINTEILEAKEATCTSKGITEGLICNDCGTTLKHQTEVDEIPHTEVEIPAVPSSCTEHGTTAGVRCSACSQTLVEPQEAPLAAHDVIDIPEVPSTCSKQGTSAGKKCINCGETIIEPMPLPIADHNIIDIPAVPSTCKTHGTTGGQKCSVCSKIIVQPVEAPLVAHVTVAVPGVAATCTEKGRTAGIKCSVCGTVISLGDIIPATGHKEVVVQGQPATCTRDGLTDGSKCEYCGITYKKQETIPARGHSFDGGVIVRPATDDQRGIIKYTCTVCGYYYEQTTDVAPHVHIGGVASCIHKAICSICGTAYGEYDNTNHNHTQAIPDREPSCAAAGSKGGMRCTDCGTIVVKPVEMPALGHIDEDDDGFCDRDGVDVTSQGSDNNVTWNTYRCPSCDKYDVLKQEPLVGWIYAIVHFFQHLISWIQYLIRL